MERIKRYFKMEDALEGIKQPLDYNYFKTLRFYLKIVNCWPADEHPKRMSKTRAILGAGYLIFFLSFLVASCLYITSRNLSFLEITQASANAISYQVASLTVPLVCLSSRYKKMLRSFLNKMHIFYFKNKSSYAMETHKRVHLLSCLFLRTSEFIMYLCIIMYNVGPIYTNYARGNYKPNKSSNVTYAQAGYFASPIDITDSLKGYITGCLTNGIESFLIGVFIQMLAVIIFIVVFHVWGHFGILLNDLNSFPLPSKKNFVSCKGQNVSAEMYSKDELKYIAKRLHECIDYHRDIVKFTEEVSAAFGPPLFFHFTYHQLNLCLLLFGCSEMNVENMMRSLPLLSLLVLDLVQTSIIFELIGTRSGMLKEAVYGMPWECMDLKNKKTVLILLTNVQEPIYVFALGIAKIGVSSMAAILKTSFSYYTILRTGSR